MNHRRWRRGRWRTTGAFLRRARGNPLAVSRVRLPSGARDGRQHQKCRGRARRAADAGRQAPERPSSRHSSDGALPRRRARPEGVRAIRCPEEFPRPPTSRSGRRTPACGRARSASAGPISSAFRARTGGPFVRRRQRRLARRGQRRAEPRLPEGQSARPDAPTVPSTSCACPRSGRARRCSSAPPGLAAADAPFTLGWLAALVRHESRPLRDIAIASFTLSILTILPPLIVMTVVNKVLQFNSVSTLVLLVGGDRGRLHLRDAARPRAAADHQCGRRPAGHQAQPARLQPAAAPAARLFRAPSGRRDHVPSRRRSIASASS